MTRTDFSQVNSDEINSSLIKYSLNSLKVGMDRMFFVQQ